MKRIIVIALLLFSASSASPRRVVRMPTIRELCPGGAEWDKIAACIKRQTPFTVVRDDDDVKLLRVDERSRFNGLYLFTHAKDWKLQGEVRVYQEHDLLRFDRATYGKHVGYR